MKSQDATTDTGVATVDPATLSRPPAWHRARVTLAAAEQEHARITRHLEDLDAADTLHRREAERHAEQRRLAGRDLPIRTVAEAARYAGAGDSLTQYHEPIDQADHQATQKTLAAAEAAVAAARADVDALASERWDAAAEAARVGARYTVAAIRLPLGGADLYCGDPVPPDAWAALPWPKRDALIRARFVVEVGR